MLNRGQTCQSRIDTWLRRLARASVAATAFARKRKLARLAHFAARPADRRLINNTISCRAAWRHFVSNFAAAASATA